MWKFQALGRVSVEYEWGQEYMQMKHGWLHGVKVVFWVRDRCLKS